MDSIESNWKAAVPSGSFSEFSIAESGRIWSFTKPADTDSLLDKISEAKFDKDRFLPYWAEFWPASEVMFGYLASRAFAANARICDLGCGLGIISSLLGSRSIHVTAIDISPEACTYTAANASRYSSAVHAVCADWRTPFLKCSFDLIVAADVLYEEHCLDPVINFLVAHIPLHGKAIISDPCRKHWSRFKQQIVAKGFKQEKLYNDVVNDGKTTIEIIELAKTRRCSLGGIQ